MKWCILGADHPHSLEAFYRTALQELNQVVEIIPTRRLFGDYYNGKLANKLKHRLGLSRIYNRLNELARQEVEASCPDVVWVFKGMEIFPETLREMKKKGVVLVNFNPDHPYIFSGYGSGNQNVSNGLPHYDMHFCYAKSVMDRIEGELGVKCQRLPFGYSLTHDSYDLIRSEPEVLRACFVGFCAASRLKVVEALKQAKVPLDVYGKGWKGKIQPSSTLRLFEPVYNEEYWRVLRTYRVQLNMLRLHNLGNHNMRTFEVPAVGGIMLTQRSDEQAEFFKVSEEIFDFSNTAELVEQINQLLLMSKERASAIRERARRRSLESGYGYHERAQTVLASVQSIRNERPDFSISR